MDSTAEALLLPPPSPERKVAAKLAVVDNRGRQFSSSETGGWTAALLIIGVEVAERFSYYGIASNLVTFLTGPMKEDTAAAAAAVNAWSGTAAMLPLLGAFIADSFIGRYRTIIASSLLYILALGSLTLTSVLMTSAGGRPTGLLIFAFYVSLYLVAVGQGGHKPCAQAFGADQFDGEPPPEEEEAPAKSSFFNWWYLGSTAGAGAAITAVIYVQDNLGWGLGFGIPCAVMSLALVIFLAGTSKYRHCNNLRREETLFAGATAIRRLFPIWATCLVFGVVYAQSATFFTKQAATLDRRIAGGAVVPPAAMQVLIVVAIVVFVPVYDRLIVPAARKLTGRPSGITELQRIGAGIFLSVVAMAAAAVAEAKRLRIAEAAGLVDSPEVPLPMSLWWMVPQYGIMGAAEVLAVVGLQELFYGEVPGGIRSLGIAMYHSVIGVGSFVSSVVVTAIDGVSRGGGGSEGWFANNLNRGHLDYFYWILVGMSVVEFVVFVFFARRYTYT